MTDSFPTDISPLMKLTPESCTKLVAMCSLFIECVDGAGVLEWNTANDSYVALHNITGVVTGAPADDMIFVGNNADSRATMLKPGGKQTPCLTV